MRRRVLWLALSCVLGTGVLFTGCSDSDTNKETTKEATVTDEPEEEEVYYADEDFITDMGKGLEARWTLNDADEEKEGYDEIQEQSDEEKKMMLSYIDAELDNIGKYTDEKFEDSNLQELAIKYVNLLKKHKEICKYIPVDYDGKYTEEFDPIYNERSKIIEDLVENYGLTVDEKYQDTLDEFITNSQLVKEQDAQINAVSEMLGTISFEEASDESGWKTYESIVENTTGTDFQQFYVTINLLDEDGVIVDTMYDTVGDFKDGAKAKLDFSTDKEFDSTEVSASWN